MYYSNGNYIPKKITDCTDREICEEFLYHIGVPKNKFSEIEAEENKKLKILARNKKRIKWHYQMNKK